MTDVPDRYHRQTILRQIGRAGQQRLASARVLVVGCGALGCNTSMHLARAGVGQLTIVDRDLVDLTNLHRQILFDESDAREQRPKATAAAGRLAAANSSIQITSVVADFHSGNAEEIAGFGKPEGAELILDGTDNVQTRYLINDVAVKHNIPWVYGGCVGMEGRLMVVVPGETACLRCLFEEQPAPGELATCDTAGVLGSAAGVVGAMEASAAIRLLVEGRSGHSGAMLAMDLWAMQMRRVQTGDARREDCPCCGRREFEFIERPIESDVASLCGRNAVQVRTVANSADLRAIARALAAVGPVQNLGVLLRCDLPEGQRLSVFADGRVIVDGTSDVTLARTLVARYVGA